VTSLDWTDLTALPRDRWITAQLKGTSTDVELVVLHHDAGTGAAVSLVRFPAGLTREELGAYPAAEELAILDGSLVFAGHTFSAGDYAYVPPRVTRTPMSSPEGLLVLAWFSAAPAWLTDPAERIDGEVTRRRLEPGTLREPSANVAGTTAVLERTEVPEIDAANGRDLFDIDGARWCFVPAGERAPTGSGAIQVRTWPVGTD
jgi:hypothetical protein